MEILLLKPVGFNYSKDAPHFGFPYPQHFLSQKYVIKWIQKFDCLCRSYMRIYLFIAFRFFSMFQGILQEYLKTFFIVY